MDIARGYEVKEFYFMIIRLAEKRGLPLKEAKDEANYYVELFYNLSPRSRQNVIQQYNTERKRRKMSGAGCWSEEPLRIAFHRKLKQMYSMLMEVGDEVQ